MAGKNDSGDKTEKPTPKRLRDARKKGDVPKSKELTSTAGLFAWLLVGVLSIGFVGRRLGDLAGAAFRAAGDPSIVQIGHVGSAAGQVFLLIAAITLVPVVLFSLSAEFAQVGPVLTFEKVKPKLDKLNPVEGFKRMVSMDNLVEVLKALGKTVLILAVGAVVVILLLPHIMTLPEAHIGNFAAVIGRLTLAMVAATAGFFVLVALADAAYQKHSFIKKQKMSTRDIKQEHKEQEGDPHLKNHRRQTAIEQSQTSPAMAARQASVLLTNPTHLAVAIHFDEEERTVPTMSGKGEGEVAAAMRQAAEEAGVPTLRDVRLARALYKSGAEGDPVPEVLFNDVATVLVWAREMRETAQQGPEGEQHG